MFPPNDLPSPGQFLLVTDELSSPADFLLHRSVADHLKRSSTSSDHCIILSVSEGLSRWKSIAAKTNINLSNLPPSKSFTFIDVLDVLQSFSLAQASSPLRPLYDVVSSKLAHSESHALVILDDIAALEWTGRSFVDVSRFSRALRALCLKAKASLIIRHHLVELDDEPDHLFRHLLQLCTYHMDVRPLSSGRSGAVSGEVALHAGPSTCLPELKTIPRALAVQYRLTDSGSVFFERGTGGGVL
ncbi:hypothetical protein PLICRDRAFT_155896 [Plicaturopsis crispa FD-325 SS-3]|nr:hypothetical protein PLICRDRAFT_155896 [Plicaturopsis crispa FD-325 SS-3]